MKKYLAVVLLASLFTAACAKKTDSARTVTKPPATAGQSTAADQQAAALGLNISWEKSELGEVENDGTTLTHTFTLNGASQSITHTVNTFNAGLCSDRAKLDYDADMGTSSTPNVYTAVGSSACWEGSTLYVGLSFMAWSTSQALVQNFVLINVSNAQVNTTQKLVATQTSGLHLPDWVYSQFTSH